MVQRHHRHDRDGVPVEQDKVRQARVEEENIPDPKEPRQRDLSDRLIPADLDRAQHRHQGGDEAGFGPVHRARHLIEDNLRLLRPHGRLDLCR